MRKFLTIILAVLVLSSLGYGGWKYWDNNDKSNVGDIALHPISYLRIEEYKVQIPLDDNTKQLKLGQIKTSQFDDKDKVVPVFAPELDQTWICSPNPTDGSKGLIGSISITMQNERAGPYKPLVAKKVGSVTYGYEQSGDNCTKSTRYQELVDNFKAQFQRIGGYTE